MTLLRSPDAKLSAQVHHAHDVKHAIIVALFAARDGRIPQRRNKIPRARIGSCQTRNCIGSDQPCRVPRRNLLTIQRVLIAVCVELLYRKRLGYDHSVPAPVEPCATTTNPPTSCLPCAMNHN